MLQLLQKQRNGNPAREGRFPFGKGTEVDRENPQGNKLPGEREYFTAERGKKWQKHEYPPHLPGGETHAKQMAFLMGTIGPDNMEILSDKPSSEGVGEELGESCHAMILSQINNPPRYDHLALLRIRNAASELRHAQLELAEVAEEQAQLQQEFAERASEQWQVLLRKVKDEIGKGRAVVGEAERREETLVAENEALQEHIFDMEQRMVGVELEVERRLKERGRQAEKQAAALAREESQEVIAQLQAELAAIRQKSNNLQPSVLPAQIREREYELSERQHSLVRLEQQLRDQSVRLDARKQTVSQREQDLMAGEENLARKISELRKKEAELSEWEAELTRKTRAVRPSREGGEDHSRVELSREASLKSFGAVHRDELMIAPTSLEQLGVRRRPTLNNEQEPQSPRDPLTFIRERRQARQNGESAYLPLRDGGEGRRYNPQNSGIQQSREASPYRILLDPKGRDRDNSRSRHTPVLPRRDHLLPSREQRLPSKQRGITGSQIILNRPRKDSQCELGSKLERLREQIKKQIDSIK